jgi:hypothetical protein
LVSSLVGAQNTGGRAQSCRILAATCGDADHLQMRTVRICERLRTRQGGAHVSRVSDRVQMDRGAERAKRWEGARGALATQRQSISEPPCIPKCIPSHLTY